MSEQERINKLEERFNTHISDSNERDIAILSGMASLNATISSQADLIASKIMEKMDEKYVSKEYAKNLISKEREKSDGKYVLRERHNSMWNDCYKDYSNKELDTFSKKVRVWGFFQALIISIVGFIVGMIVRSGSFISGFIK